MMAATRFTTCAFTGAVTWTESPRISRVGVVILRRSKKRPLKSVVAMGVLPLLRGLQAKVRTPSRPKGRDIQSTRVTGPIGYRTGRTK